MGGRPVWWEELLVLEGPAVFDLLGVQKWGFWWMDPPRFPEAVCAPCPEEGTSGALPAPSQPMIPFELIQSDQVCSSLQPRLEP